MPGSCRYNALAIIAAVLVGVAACDAGAQEQPPPPPPAFDKGTDPSPLLHEPKTPEELFAATLMMIDLARLDLADRYLSQFLESDPDDALLLKLRDKYGTGEFLKLTRIKQLRGKALGLAEKLSAASRKQAEDPEYADVLIAKLGADPVQRELAIRELKNLSEAAVPHLMRKLVNPDSPAQIDQIVLAIGRIGQPAVAPTIAGLEAPQPSVRLASLAALKLLKSSIATPYLWHPAFFEGETPEIQRAAREALVRILSNSDRGSSRISAELAVNELRRIARGLYGHEFELPLEDDGTVTIWTWNDEAGTVVKTSSPPERAQLLLSTRFAKQWLDLSPENPESQRMYLGSQLGWAVAEQGRNRPISTAPDTPGSTALTAGEATVTDVLADALSAGQAGTAQAALQILGQIGSSAMIQSGNGRKSPVVSALNYPDLRIQFAAANAILRLEPNRAFRGADRVGSILTQAISYTDERKALIIDADLERAEITTGFLSELGYTPVKARTGKEGFVVASTTAGIDLAVIHINCIQWDLSQTVANFRADSRTAYLPIVFYGPEDITDVETKFGRKNAMAFPEAASPIWGGTLPPGGRLDPLEATTRTKLYRLIQRSGPATFVAESGSASDFVDQVRPFMASVSGSQLSEEERSQYQAAAVRWFAHLSQADRGSIIDLNQAEGVLSEVLENPALAPMAIVALSGIGSNTVQQRFESVVINSQVPASLRASAANQLAFHIQRHGVMLTEDQVRALTNAWKSETDPVVASALAAVIGSLNPEPKVVGERIGKLPAPR